MRYSVKKFLFFGDEADRDSFFKEAQQAGFIQFVDPSDRKIELPEPVARIIAAKKVLRRLEPVSQEELENLDLANQMAERIVHLNDVIQHLEEEERMLEEEIARVSIFGDFSMHDFRYLQKQRHIQFFVSKTEAEDDPELFYVGTAYELYHYVSISKEKREFEGLTEMHIEHPLGELREKQEAAHAKKMVAEEELKTFAKRKNFLREALVEQLNSHHLLTAQSFTEAMFGDKVFAIEGWAPENHIEDLEKLIQRFTITCEEIGPDEKETVPTFLENHKFARVGEDLVHIYDTPSENDRDPSRWVLWFFAFFFGVIMGDAVYGAILLVVSLLLFWKLAKKGGMIRRFATLCIIVSSMSMVWGVLTNSYLGLEISPDSSIRNVSLTNWLAHKKVDYVRAHPEGSLYKEWTEKYPILTGLNTSNGWFMKASRMREGKLTYELMDRFEGDILMELAILIGVLHIIFGFLRMIDKVWSGIGWILFMIGGYLFFPSILQAVSLIHFVFAIPADAGAAQGLQLIWLGIVIAVGLALVQRKWSGFAEITNVVQVFADVLSYLRLYALALAGGMMSATFNDLGLSVSLALGIPIMILGHMITITLDIMGGVIHGLRLNFLEWYRHCFEGGGAMLQPLKLLK